jgi:hypothetical protein
MGNVCLDQLQQKTLTRACRHYLPSEYTSAFANLGMFNKELYEVNHQTLEYLRIFQFGAWQHELM